MIDEAQSEDGSKVGDEWLFGFRCKTDLGGGLIVVELFGRATEETVRMGTAHWPHHEREVPFYSDFEAGKAHVLQLLDKIYIIAMA